mmetsp:Transcript_2469/g.3639  ORF Transcript_2469/g.3639 Transcript_2469/m.3639 type:complete len:323 (+) Transcript_2469:146-1114(+)
MVKIIIYLLFTIFELSLCKANHQDRDHIVPPSKWIQEQLIVLRGGDRYDEENDRLSRRRNMPTSNTRRHRDQKPEKSYRRRENPYNSRPLLPRRRAPSALNAAASVAKKTVDITSAAAWTTLKGSGKAAFYLAAPKHVERREVVGVWRLDQSVGDKLSTVCAANVEFTPKGDVIVNYDDETFVTPFLFRERNWPQSCTIEFEARAFQGPHDERPVLMRYKGYFRRKLADSNVIKIVGDIYVVSKTGWRRGDGKRIGSFVARRRLIKTRKNIRDDEGLDHDNGASEEEFEDDFEDKMEGYEDKEENYDEDEDEISNYDEYDDY